MILCPSTSPLAPKTSPYVHRRLLLLRPRPIWYCSSWLSPKSPHNWCSRMDRWLCPLSFGCRRCRYPCGLRKMLIFLFTVLLNWLCLLQLLSWVLCTGTWPRMVSLPSKIMSLSIGPFPNGLPDGPHLLSSAPAFLQPKFFWDIWDLSNSLSFRVAVSFQWVPGHAGLPGNEWADSLAKTGATLSVTRVPLPLAPTIAKTRHIRYSFLQRNLSHNSLSCQIPSVYSE